VSLLITVTANKQAIVVKIKIAAVVNSGVVGLGDAEVPEESDITETLLLSE
jgi:hypothetical protein